MKHCDDEPAADKFVTTCQKVCDSVYEHDSDLNDAEIADITAEIYKAMLYKVGKIDYSLCGCCCVTRFDRKGTTYAEKSYKRLKLYITIVLIINLGLQLALTILD